MIGEPTGSHGLTVAQLAKELLKLLKPQLEELVEKPIIALRDEFKQEIDGLREEFLQNLLELRRQNDKEFIALRDEFKQQMDSLREEFLQNLLELRSENDFYRREREYLLSRYGKIRTLEETLSARNVAAIFDEEGPIPHWKKL